MRLEALFDLSNESSLWRKGLSGDEEAEMRALLQSVGVSSWTEYSVLRMSPTVPPALPPSAVLFTMATKFARSYACDAHHKVTHRTFSAGSN